MKQLAIVRWFDGLSGEGMVRLNNGQSVYVHFTAIEGISKHNRQWPLKQDQEHLSNIKGLQCIVTVNEELSQIETLKLVA